MFLKALNAFYVLNILNELEPLVSVRVFNVPNNEAILMYYLMTQECFSVTTLRATFTLGCKVAIASRDLAKLEMAANEMSSIGQVEAISCNIRNEEEVNSAVASTLSKFGKLDFLVKMTN